MCRIVCAVFFLCSMLFSSLLCAQGIQTPYINLGLSGKWKECSAIRDELKGFDLYSFCEENTGALLRILVYPELRAVRDISPFFGSAGQSGASTDGTKLLVNTVFPIPQAYLNAVAPALRGQGRAPRMWDLKEGGNAQWFYVSQLFGGYKIKGGANQTIAVEDYYPVRVTRAENRTVTGANALLFEAETDQVAMEQTLKRFQVPSGVNGQKVRYGWVQYAPGGIRSGFGVLSIVFAAPANSALDVTSVLQEVIANFGKTTAGLQ